MIIGEGKLKELFPNFKDDIEANGIDLRIGEVYQIVNNGEIKGCIDDKKYKPEYIHVPVNKHYNAYIFKPHEYYFIKIDRPIHIPKGYIQRYLLRSTFTRSGLILTDAVGDSDFNGTLMLGVYNSNNDNVYAGKNERIIQAVTESTDDTVGSYTGSYQHDSLYK